MHEAGDQEIVARAVVYQASRGKVTRHSDIVLGLLHDALWGQRTGIKRLMTAAARPDLGHLQHGNRDLVPVRKKQLTVRVMLHLLRVQKVPVRKVPTPRGRYRMR